MSHLQKLFPHVLVLVAVILTGWGTLGLIEYFFPAVALGLQAPTFPAGTQLLHFLAILATGVVFLGGYFTRWRHTPFATIVMYAVLATLCFVETVDFHAFGVGPTRFIPMVIEYVTYVGFSTYLLRSSVMRDRFSSSSETTDGAGGHPATGR